MEKESFKKQTILGRNLSDTNVNIILLKFEQLVYSKFETHKNDNPDDIWLHIKTKIIEIVDQIAPIKEIKIKSHDQLPWVDAELLYVLHMREIHYKKF